MSILGLIPKPPGKVVGGRALYRGRDLLQMSKKDLRQVRGKKISVIFQDPMTCLNPYLSIETQITEVLYEHEPSITKLEARTRALEAMRKVGIADVERRISEYPHQFSGGMRQRVMIAMAIVTNPDILIADEPTTALDVTIQAQILDLLRDMQKELGVSIILITHDLGVVAGMADYVSVMYAGRHVEHGSVDEIFYESSHPYTYGLLKSNPQSSMAKNELYSIEGLPPDPTALPVGCPFAPRCVQVHSPCRTKNILPTQTFSDTHSSLCYLEDSSGKM
jgi:oligopeptide/dipeptide ABC transporter, ATP-binding protein, C-terminal domain